MLEVSRILSRGRVTQGLSAEEAAADHVPIVALTADDSREMCLQVGMDDYLSKPVDKAAFYEMLQRYAHQKQQRIRANMLNQRYAPIRSDCQSALVVCSLFFMANDCTGAHREATR